MKIKKLAIKIHFMQNAIKPIFIGLSKGLTPIFQHNPEKNPIFWILFLSEKIWPSIYTIKKISMDNTLGPQIQFAIPGNPVHIFGHLLLYVRI